MTLEKKFDERIASIHQADHPSTTQPNSFQNDRDIRQEEFQAMADVFLGEDFDQEALLAVENLQLSLRNQQALLYQRYQARDISPEQYVDNFNHLLAGTFMGCENILGRENFIKFFGAPRTQLAGFIDKEIFLQTHH